LNITNSFYDNIFKDYHKVYIYWDAFTKELRRKLFTASLNEKDKIHDFDYDYDDKLKLKISFKKENNLILENDLIERNIKIIKEDDKNIKKIKECLKKYFNFEEEFEIIGYDGIPF